MKKCPTKVKEMADMHSMHFHCLAVSSAVFFPNEGITDCAWCELGGAPAELGKLHLASASFRGCAEGPLPPAVGHASCYLQVIPWGLGTSTVV